MGGIGNRRPDAVSWDPLAAVIWDFDGTLVDSRSRNLAITREILMYLVGDAITGAPALRDVDSYSMALRRCSNWRDLYRTEFGLSEDLVEAAGKLWSTYQLADRTPYSAVLGVADAVIGLGRFRQGIVSQGSRPSILRWLEDCGLSRYVQAVVGYEEVPADRQKPHPDGLLQCIEHLAVHPPATVLYVGDHETDVATATHANAVFAIAGQALRVLSVGASYCEPEVDHRWESSPDYWARTPAEVVRLAGLVEDEANQGRQKPSGSQ